MSRQISSTPEDVTRLRQEITQREAELEIINSVQQALASRLDVQAIYDLVGEKILHIFNTQVVMISIYDPLTDTVEHRYAIENGRRVYSPGPHPPGGFRSHIIRTRQPLHISANVAAESERLGQPVLPGTKMPRSWLGVPMLVNDQVTGVLSLQNVEQENVYTDSDVRLLQTLAASMSVALENARLWEQENLYRRALEREFEIGRQIQADFLPANLPQPSGWEIAASLKPAREVAGDFYDVFLLPADRVGLVIADVCDKGLGAALFMTLFRSLLRAVANLDFYARVESAVPASPAVRLQNAVSLTNNYIAETHGDTGMFATAFFGILDTHTGSLAYINCGHLPPFLANRDGIRKTLPPTGPAVGVFPDAAFTIAEEVLQPGDLLFAYTDGLTDTENPSGEYFTVAGLVSLLNASLPPSSLLEQIHDRLSIHAAGARQYDDITLLAVRRKNRLPPE